ncbi:MAG: ATP-binding protein [Pseudomonadota bacterium]
MSVITPEQWSHQRIQTTRWLPKLRYRVTFLLVLIYVLMCIPFNLYIQSTVEKNIIDSEQSHLEHIAQLYRNNPLIDRHSLVNEGHSLWEVIGQTFDSLANVSLLDNEGAPLICFYRTPSPLNHFPSSPLKPSSHCKRIHPPAPNPEGFFTEYVGDTKVLWHFIESPSLPSSWLRLEITHTTAPLTTSLFRLYVYEVLLGIILAGSIYTITLHLENHLESLTQSIKLFDYSGFKESTDHEPQWLPWVLFDLERVISGLMNRVKKEIQRLEQSESEISHLLNHIPGAIIQHNEQQQILFLSPSWSSIIGNTAFNQLKKKTFADLIHPDDVDAYQTHIKHAFHHPKLTFFCKIRLRDAQPEVVLALSSVTHTQINNTLTLVTHAIDCSHDYKTIRHLQQENNHYRLWLDQLPLPLYVKNVAGQYLFFNAAWEKLTQIPQTQWIGKTAWDVFEPAYAQTLWDHERETFEHEGITIYETDVRSQSGHTQRALIYRTPMIENDQSSGIIGLIISLDKQTHYTLLQTRLEQAEQHDRQHTKMLAHLSSQVRTHMHSLLGLVDLMSAWLKTLALPHSHEYLSLIQTLAHGILNTTTDVNDILSFEQRTALAHPSMFNVEAILIECARHFSPQAESKHLELIVNADTLLPTEVEGDVNLLRRALDVLVHNAIKFTPHGQVELSVSLLQFEGDHAHLRFTVADTGIGIAEDQHSMIFEPFTQGDAMLSRQHHGGAGLGLAVFSRLMHHIGAHYTITSHQGQGTNISFDLILPYSQQPLLPILSEPHLKTVLIVEHHARTAQVITQHLTKWATQVLTARSAQQAFKVLDTNDPSHVQIDAILIDGRLSDEDRSAPYRILEAAKKIDIQHRIIMLPVHAPFHEHERYKQAHASTVLLKPIHSKELLKALTTATASSNASDTTFNTELIEHNAHIQSSKNINILLATHDPINKKLVEGWLEQFHHRCVTVTTTEELMSYYNVERFTAVLIDLDMTRPSGTELLRIVNFQNQVINHNTPIIAMLSGKEGEQHLIPNDTPVWALVNKPIQQNTLTAMLKSLISPITIAADKNLA